MSVTAVNSPVIRAEERIKPEGLWLRSRNWDTFYMTMSVFLVPLPYLVYLLGVNLGIHDDVARNGVNLVVALLVGGPHMYATFLRTALDKNFVKRYPMLIRSSIIIPIVVVSLAFLNLSLLLTIFFFWASIHVLHQVTYVVELYNHRATGKVKGSAVTLWARLIDYALILTCLFPIAALKISRQDFRIGTNDLTKVIPDFFFTKNPGEVPWFFLLMAGLFGVALVAFLIKSYIEWRGGYIHWPKTIFILISALVAATMPALDNLDTAFQGLNTWHSFQYLALTFYLIKLREQSGDLNGAMPTIRKFAADKSSARLYMFSASMILGSLVLGFAVYMIVGIVDPSRSANARFDTAYYTAILCFLWIHYYHDHFLFTDFEAIERQTAPAA
ncbi:MAG: hypothetical protein KF716_18825 [Anaerolineae bacterium]|nr:hypothetical protein [Anaerolineae bacterium]